MRPRIVGIPSGRRGRRGVATIAVASILLCPLASDRAAAETIILRGGTSVPCRILLETKEKVVVRKAGGVVETYRRKEIVRIDRSVSSVEVYEAVAERISEGDLSAALHLGYWCLENGLKGQAKRLFKIASRDNASSARALLALANHGGDAAARRALLAKAVTADPSLQEARDALGKMDRGDVELPTDLMGLWADLFGKLPSGKAKDIRRCTSIIDRYPDAKARACSAERFFAFTGLSLTDIRRRCGAQHGDARLSAEGKCATCGGTGHTRCPICHGKGDKPCRRCKGTGKMLYNKRISHRKTITVDRICAACKGSGVIDCGACSRLVGEPRGIKKVVSLNVVCKRCDGTGALGARVYRGGAWTSKCLACEGAGIGRTDKATSQAINSSGWRRCNNCNKQGSIPFPGTDPDGDLLRALDASSRAKHVSILEPEEQTRLTALGSVFQHTPNYPNLRLQAGPKVPFSFAAAKQDGEIDAQVFAFGRWCAPSIAKMKARAEGARVYRPRDVDLSQFNGWMRDQEIAYLRGRAKPIGSGSGAEAAKSSVDDVKALVAALESAGRESVSGDLEQSTVIRTTFTPRGAVRVRKTGGKQPLACLLDISAHSVSLVLLSDPGAWPASEVVLAPLPKEASGLDFEPVAREVRSNPQALTLYYLIRSSHRKIAGKDLDATTRVVLSAEVLAATLGPADTPTKIWVRGVVAP